MVTIGFTRNSNVCSLCQQDVEIGAPVFFDPTKPIPHHIIHFKCGWKLLESRGEKYFKTPKGAAVVTVEELDAPF